MRRLGGWRRVPGATRRSMVGGAGMGEDGVNTLTCTLAVRPLTLPPPPYGLSCGLQSNPGFMVGTKEAPGACLLSCGRCDLMRPVAQAAR